MSSRGIARQLATAACDAGAPLSWFETLYSQADGDHSTVPWADMSVNPNLADWLSTHDFPTPGGSALVVGCGLGDDAEELARLGLKVTAFDISPTCIAWCKRRFPDSAVQYLRADLFDAPAAWTRAFDFVFEAYTLQVLPPELRKSAIRHIANFVGSAGTLLVITRARDEADDRGLMPWPLLRTELDRFVEHGLKEEHVEDFVEAEDPPVRRFRAVYKRHA
ncbi:MAG: class I SAM-dependent methyltransferase [Planctomycetaceae bacterium]